jgi:hypothetical protein
LLKSVRRQRKAQKPVKPAAPDPDIEKWEAQIREYQAVIARPSIYPENAKVPQSDAIEERFVRQAIETLRTEEPKIPTYGKRALDKRIYPHTQRIQTYAINRPDGDLDPALNSWAQEIAGRSEAQYHVQKLRGWIKERKNGATKKRSHAVLQGALKKLDNLWYHNDYGRTLQRGIGTLQHWLNKVPVTKGETSKTVGEEAWRLWRLSVPPLGPADEPSARDPADVKELQEASADPEHYLLQTLEGVTVYFTEEDHDHDNFTYIIHNLEVRGKPTWMPNQSDIVLRSVEEELGVKCQWVLAPEPPIEPQEAPDPNTPLVTVEQIEESKRHGYVEERNGFPINYPPKPYHLTINRPQNELGWLAAHDKLFSDGPTYVPQYDVWQQLRATLAAPPLFDEGLDQPKAPNEHTCFQEFRRLMAQWVFKLSKDELDKLRKVIHRTSNPKYWAQFAKDLKGD